MTNNAAKVMLYYSYDTFDETIPSKDSSYSVDKILVTYQDHLSKYRDMQKDLGDREKSNYVFTEQLDTRIINVTILEIGIIFLAFTVEIIILNSYLKNKELI